MRALLDVNVLIAIHDPDHVHHRQASEWLSRNIRAGWASCNLTQNECLRVMAQPASTWSRSDGCGCPLQLAHHAGHTIGQRLGTHLLAQSLHQQRKRKGAGALEPD